MNWDAWIYSNWKSLAGGAKIHAPIWLGPPSEAGFRPTTSAAHEGQSADWSLGLTDRSRIHVHEYADGRRLVHRDAHDPDRGLADMAAHLALDTPFVAAAVVVGAVWWMSQQNE
jgi:hypothetical protein